MKMLFYVTALLALLLAACSDDTKKEVEPTSSTKTAEEKTKDESKEDVYFKDGEAKLVDLKIKITKTKVIHPGEKGNEYGDKPVFAIWYDTTNLSGKDIDPSTAWIAVFEVIQDNNPNSINELEIASLPDDQFLDSQLETIKKGGTVSNAVAYELDDLKTPVKIIAYQGIGGKKLGEMEFPIK